MILNLIEKPRPIKAVKWTGGNFDEIKEVASKYNVHIIGEKLYIDVDGYYGYNGPDLVPIGNYVVNDDGLIFYCSEEFLHENYKEI